MKKELSEQMESVIIQGRQQMLACAIGDTYSVNSLWSNASINQFILNFSDIPSFAGYKHVSISARRLHQQIRNEFGIQKSREFLYACILQALLISIESEKFLRLPDRIKGHQLKQFLRILAHSSEITDVCEIESDLFHKEMGLATTRLYAAAAQLIDFRTGIGRSMLVKNGLGDFANRVGIFFKIGGFKPFFEIHTHLSYLDEFNEEGWNECYRCCADLYEVHPRVLGMQGGSWFYDPALAYISPRLGYLREVPQKGGAYLLFTSSGEHSVHDATSTSPTRKKLYEEGKYQPKNYTLVWPRDAQIEWAKTCGLQPQVLQK